MSMPPAIEYLEVGASLGEAVLCLKGAELDAALNRIVRDVFRDANVAFRRGKPEEQGTADHVHFVVAPETYYALSGKKGRINEADIAKLNLLASLTAQLFSTRARLDQEQQASTQEQWQQTQIIEHIHESVITMDLAGFIISWNRGAQKLFGYTAEEVIGKNILFLYEEQDSDGELLYDSFLEHGGREMEVRRKKKSGEVFWASLNLSPLCDASGMAIGIIGYLSDITARKDAEQKINHLAYYDALTNLPNRSLFRQLVDNALLQSQRNSSSAAIIFIDLNRFKLINDTLGHDIGNELLRQVAARFQLTLRENDIVARLGSDEFAIALLDINQHFQASMVVQKLLHALNDAFMVAGHELRVGASIGISVFPQDGSEANALLQKADIAMYKAKRGAGNASGSFMFYSDSMNQSMAGRLYLESSMRKALENHEFYLQYQPKVDIKSGKIIGAEALVRWQRPDKGLISPAEFIPVAEETGLILQIDAWVLDTACAQARQWQDNGVMPFRIAVNVSAREFTNNLPVRVKEALQRHQISPEWLELEITESMLMHSAESVIAIMEQITAQGVVLALDDFGTGYSSLSYLKRFPIKTLKIDRSFIQGIPADKNDCAIAGAIILMAKQLNHKVIAEGVETRKQLDFLIRADCDEVQGYLYSRPVSAEQLLVLLNKGFLFKD
ncbi:EAL domain-containing protein [Undibacterium sp. TS12]|uniref:putative bifunctional diguanylate cyclase/phosphodiesterase n=1 Tax=Undibacterium sp. TS12 TaxID=2908202 RepID=UPI001F4C875E|nr:EAL domain-containing protein [Undibacterium sp. TS12]MCH8618770.1 EAL domain-containing protein [Undibacterium sp. TS12]